MFLKGHQKHLAPSLDCIPNKSHYCGILLLIKRTDIYWMSIYILQELSKTAKQVLCVLFYYQGNCDSKNLNNSSMSNSCYMSNQDLSSTRFPNIYTTSQCQSVFVAVVFCLLFPKSMLAFKEGKSVWKNYICGLCLRGSLLNKYSKNVAMKSFKGSSNFGGACIY